HDAEARRQDLGGGGGIHRIISEDDARRYSFWWKGTRRSQGAGRRVEVSGTRQMRDARLAHGRQGHWRSEMNQFLKHFTVEEARELLPELRRIFKDAHARRERARHSDENLGRLLRKTGADIG